MKGFPVNFTLTVMRRQATPLIMKDIPVTFTLTGQRRHPWLPLQLHQVVAQVL